MKVHELARTLLEFPPNAEVEFHEGICKISEPPIARTPATKEPGIWFEIPRRGDAQP